MAPSRIILHADMDAFYAAVEQRDRPDLRAKPVAVGGAPPRGVIAAASYEARPYGVRSAMPTIKALRACPQLIVLPPRIDYYARISQQVFGIFDRYSPRVESLSLDEAFLDLSGTSTLHGSALEVGQRIKKNIWDELSLVVSIGIGPSKFIAKIASDLEKPDGLVSVSEDALMSFLAPLPVSRLWGVGKVMCAHFERMGIRTIGELGSLGEERLVSRFGKHGRHLWCLARGIDDREVLAERICKSIGHETTFEKDCETMEELQLILCQQADRVARRLRKKKYRAKTVVLKTKTADFKIRTRRQMLDNPTQDGMVLSRIAADLLASQLPTLGKVRLIGVSATGLIRESAPRQLSFNEVPEERADALGRALDAIEDRFGSGLIVRGPHA